MMTPWSSPREVYQILLRTHPEIVVAVEWNVTPKKERKQRYKLAVGAQMYFRLYVDIQKPTLINDNCGVSQEAMSPSDFRVT